MFPYRNEESLDFGALRVMLIITYAICFFFFGGGGGAGSLV